MWQQIKEFFRQLFDGAKLSIISFQAYYYYKKLLIFPLLIALGSTITVTVFFVVVLTEPFFHVFQQHPYLIGFPVVMVLYFLISSINVFFKLAATYTLAEYCQSGHASIFGACWQSMCKWKVLLPWAAIEAVVFSASGKKDNHHSGDSMVDFILKTTWRYLSFFIYPIFAFEELTIFASLKRSTNLMKKNLSIISGSLGLVSLVLSLAGLLLVGIVYSFQPFVGPAEWLCFNVREIYFPSFPPGHFFILLVISYVGFIFVFLIQLIVTAQTIMSTLLYRHIHKQSTGFLSSKVLEKALEKVQKA